MRNRISVIRNLLTALVFVALITTPVIFHLLGKGAEETIVENRRLSPPPDLSNIAQKWTGLSEEANAWMRDNFGLRRTYLKIGFAMDTLLRSSSGYKAVRGDEGWLFNRLDGALALHQGLLPFAAGEADKWLDGLVEVKQAAEASGATFVAMIAPNKHTVYPEYLQDFPRQAAGETRLDEVQRLAGARGLPLIDLRPVLQASKTREKIYFQTDSHWTDMGAYLAYGSLRTVLSARDVEIPDLPRNALQITVDPAFRGDLYGLLGEENGAPETARMIKVDSAQINPKAGSILLIGDSFAARFMKYLHAGFEKAEFVDNYAGAPRLDDIDAGQYDIIVYQVVERYLSRPFQPLAANN